MFSLSLFSRSDIEPIDPSEVADAVEEVFIQEYFKVASLVVLVYDVVITFDKEIKYFWKIPRRPVDFVYFANRYIGILGASAIIYCNFAEWTHDIANWTTVIFVDYILMIRVLALYSQDVKLSICLHTLLALEAAFKLAIFIYLDVLEHVVVGGLAKDVTFCGVDTLVPWQWGLVDWVIPLGYGVILVILVLYKAANYWRLSDGLKGSALVKILIEEQILYFLLVVACSVFAILGFKLEIPNIILSDFLGAFGNPSFLCVLGNRMLFNMKEAGERGENEGTGYRAPSRTVSEMDFAQIRPETSEVVEHENLHDGCEPALDV